MDTANPPRTSKTTPFLIRMRPEVRALLERASQDQHRSMASVIDQCVRDQLQPRYGHLGDRLHRLLGSAK
jgi:predicted HicB family RNase H-like nuclease